MVPIIGPLDRIASMSRVIEIEDSDLLFLNLMVFGSFPKAGKRKWKNSKYETPKF